MRTFKAGKWYKTRLGWRAFVYETHFKDGGQVRIAGKIISPAGQERLSTWDLDGRTLKDKDCDTDLILPYEVWLNVYPDVISYVHDSREEADASNGQGRVFDRIAVVKVYAENSQIFTEVYYD
jgi:hypothetical protein